MSRFTCWRCGWKSEDKHTPQGLALAETNHKRGHEYQDWKKEQEQKTTQGKCLP